MSSHDPSNQSSKPDQRCFPYDPQRRWSAAPAPAGWRELEPTPFRARTHLSLRPSPDATRAQVSEAWPGQEVWVWAEEGTGENGWAWVSTQPDGYLGWVKRADLVPETWLPNLMVTALRAHAYAGPKVSAPLRERLCYGARLSRRSTEDIVTEDIVVEGGRRWVPVTLPGGEAAWVQEVILAPLQVDLLTFARAFLGTPYVWGGRSAWGIDCSGLTQVVYGAYGRPLPRDSDQQAEVLTPVRTPQPGDLAFFPGHVGLMLTEHQMLHANATRMGVTIETLGEGDYGSRLLRELTGYGRWRA